MTLDPVLSFSESDHREYEKNMRPQGLLEALGDRHGESMRTREHIYSNTCFNCHGDAVSMRGFLPTAFKFWKDAFQGSNDPYAIVTRPRPRGHGAIATSR